MGQTPNPYMGQTPNPYASATPNPYASATPNPYAAATPNPYAAATPNPYAAATPNPYGAATPNPYGAATPNPYASAQVLLEGIRVRILPNSGYQRGAYDGASGRITILVQSTCTVTLDSGAVLADVPAQSVEPLRPTGSGEQCLVVDGVYRSSKVTINSIDGMLCEVAFGDGSVEKMPLRLLALI